MKLNTINTPELVKKRVSAPLPEYVIQQRDAGRGQKLDYISGATVIDILNNTFGHLGWSAEYPDYWIEKGKDFVQKENAKYPFKKEANVEVNSLGERVCVQPQGDVCWAKCRLTVHLVREDGSMYSITKEAFGSKSIIGKQSEQEHIYKSAQTDALKKAASLLGIGGNLYRGENEQAYFDTISKPIVWTEEKQNSSEIWKSLENIANENGWSMSDLDYYVNELTEGAYTDIYTLPEAWAKALVEQLSEEEGE